MATNVLLFAIFVVLIMIGMLINTVINVLISIRDILDKWDLINKKLKWIDDYMKSMEGK